MFPCPEAEAQQAAMVAVEVEVAELVGLLNATHGRIVEVVGGALDNNLWQGWGILSPGHWLAWQAGMAPARARQIVKLAERRGELPLATAALVAGELSVDQAVEIARHVPAEFDNGATQLARLATVAQLRRVLPHYAFEQQLADADTGTDTDTDADTDTDTDTDTDADTDTGPDTDTDTDADTDTGPDTDTEDAGDPSPQSTAGPEPIEERRQFSMGTDEHGWWLNGHLPADEGAVVEAAIRAARDDLYRQACEDLDPDAPAPQIGLVDGLIAVAEASLRAGQAAHPGSDRYLVHTHLEAGPGNNPRGIAALHLGPLLPTHLRRLLTCDATLRPVLERDGTPTNVGRDERIVTRRTRRLIEHRDDGCAVPGCNRRSGLQIHHIIHWEDGGPTDTSNLVTLCATHHRVHHRNLLAITGNADHPNGLRFSDKWDRTLDPTGRPITPHPTGLGAAARTAGITPAAYHHPLGERLDTTAVVFYPAPPPPVPQPPEAEPESEQHNPAA